GLWCVQHLLFDRDAGNRGACFHRGPLAKFLGRSTVGERNFVAVYTTSFQIGRAQVGAGGGITQMNRESDLPSKAISDSDAKEIEQ
ncbi:MAG: hypothetical protein WCE26_12125, partial [Candidatus Acidiferrales bacterium]